MTLAPERARRRSWEDCPSHLLRSAVVRDSEPHLDRRQLAEVLGVSVRTVDRLVANGAPSELWGPRMRRFRVSEVVAWSRAQGEDISLEDDDGQIAEVGINRSDAGAPLGHSAQDGEDAALELLLALVAEANRWKCTCGVCEALRTVASNA